MVHADGLEPLMNDPDRFVAILDSDGAVRELNDTARAHLDARDITHSGKRFWALPWTGDRPRRQLQQAIQDAASGAVTAVEASLGAEGPTFEFRFLPSEDASGSVQSLVVDGREIAERERLAEELRASEELHRVTLNNMTDTVLVTDDSGKFTYVCPNVHFIFGYTAEEIYEFGTIDSLLGQDLREQVESSPTHVQTNLECAATDKHGTEHTLLVNVRQVSIQGGTKLYSCRDITKRKQREVALSQLHTTSRDLLYAETDTEVATQVAEDASDILPTGGAAIYRLDADENCLYPIAISEFVQQRWGPLPEVSLEEDASIARAFVTETTQQPRDAHTPFNRGRTPSTPVDYVAVPLGSHGVLLALTTDTDGFDPIGAEVAELLGATAEAAFDRIARENELREHEAALTRQNRQLNEVKRVSDLIREIDQEIVHADSRSSIEEAVCSRLTSDDRFTFAWVGETNAANSSLRARAWDGTEDGYLDTVSLAVERSDDDDALEPTVRAAQTRDPVAVENTAAVLRGATWCREAVSRNFHSVLAIPLAYDGVLLGTLTVYADTPDAFGEMVEGVLIELGDTIAAAINAVQRKDAIDSTAVVELEYRIASSQSVFKRLATQFACEISVDGSVRSTDDTTVVFTSVSGVEADRLRDAATGLLAVDSCDVLRQESDGGTLRFVLSTEFVSTVLSDHGARLSRMVVTPEGVELTIDVPKSVPPRSIDEAVSNLYDDAELVAQRERVRAPDPATTQTERSGVLTPRQREVTQLAYHSGFFEAKRDVTGRDIASMLDISHTAFYDHVRRAEQKLFAQLFES